jgi:hypothetical protein
MVYSARDHESRLKPTSWVSGSLLPLSLRRLVLRARLSHSARQLYAKPQTNSIGLSPASRFVTLMWRNGCVRIGITSRRGW